MRTWELRRSRGSQRSSRRLWRDSVAERPSRLGAPGFLPGDHRRHPAAAGPTRRPCPSAGIGTDRRSSAWAKDTREDCRHGRGKPGGRKRSEVVDTTGSCWIAHGYKPPTGSSSVGRRRSIPGTAAAGKVAQADGGNSKGKESRHRSPAAERFRRHAEPPLIEKTARPEQKSERRVRPPGLCGDLRQRSQDCRHLLPPLSVARTRSATWTDVMRR